MITLIDGDIVAYRCAIACEDESEKTTLTTTSAYLLDLLYDITSVTGFAELLDNKVFLSGKENFRYGICADYKANRKDLKKPKYLPLVRQHLIEAFDASISVDQEADDDIAIEASRNYLKSIIVSVDKDFMQVPGYHFNPVKRTFKEQSQEDADRAFFTQMLVGDRVDNIKGVKGIGEVKAARLLEDCTDANAMYKAVLEAYGGDVVAFKTAMQLLHLRRYPGEIIDV